MSVSPSEKLSSAREHDAAVDMERMQINADTSDSQELPVSTSQTEEIVGTTVSNGGMVSPVKDDKTETVDTAMDLSEQIVKQVEYYFSDENLVKDSFMMQRISRDKRGFVDLKLISSFKRMKKMTRDVEAIAAALRGSKKLEVNKQGTMIRRIAALPLTKEEIAAAKTVVVVNFGDANKLQETLSACGTIVRVRVISKNENVPADVRKHLRRNIEASGKATSDFALVEYEDEKCAVLACERLSDSSDWRRGLHVSMLIGKSPDRKTGSATTGNQQTSSKVSQKPDVKAGEVHDDSAVRSKRTGKKGRSRIEAIMKDETAGYSSSGSETEGTEEPKDQVRRHSSPRGNLRTGSPGGKVSGSGPNLAKSILVHRKLSGATDETHGEIRFRTGSLGTSDISSRGISPWVQRRREAAQRDQKVATSSLTDLSSGDNVSKVVDGVSVIRQPKGPDGTRGFMLVR